MLPTQNQVQWTEAPLLELYHIRNGLYLHSTQPQICTEETSKKPIAIECPRWQ